jgi:O-antigen/teichoic acid export membrane protein
MLQLLSFGLLFTRYNLAHIVYLALGRPSYVTVIGATKFISLCVLVPALFYWFGIKGAIAGVAFHMAPTVLWVFWFNWRHKLYDVRRELAVLAMWPIGWLAGIVLLHIVHA